MTNELPSLGRNPFNSLRIISGTERQSHDFVKSDATFMRGMVGRQVLDSNGEVEWRVAVPADDAKPHGILNSHKTSSFEKSVSQEPVEIDGDGDGNVTPNLVSGSVLITSTGSSVSINSLFSINLVNGVITTTYPGLWDTTVLVSYKYTILEPGVDETLGSGKVSVVRGVGEINTLVYDTSVAYAIGDLVYAGTAGVLTNVSTGYTSPTTKNVGTVVKPPTFDDPGLRIRLNNL